MRKSSCLANVDCCALVVTGDGLWLLLALSSGASGIILKLFMLSVISSTSSKFTHWPLRMSASVGGCGWRFRFVVVMVLLAELLQLLAESVLPIMTLTSSDPSNWSEQLLSLPRLEEFCQISNAKLKDCAIVSVICCACNTKGMYKIRHKQKAEGLIPHSWMNSRNPALPSFSCVSQSSNIHSRRFCWWQWRRRHSGSWSRLNNEQC